MKKAIFKVTVFTFVLCFGLFIAAEYAFCASWAEISEKIKRKYMQFGRDMKDFTIIEELRMNSPEGAMISDIKVYQKGDKFRSDTTMDIPNMPPGMQGRGMESIFIYDGQDSWMINSFTGKKKISRNKVEKHNEKIDWWNSVPENAVIVGDEVIEGHDSYVVDFHPNEEWPFSRVWFDKKSLYLVKAKSKGGEGEEMVFIFSDFRKIDRKWDVPFRTKVFRGTNLVSSLAIKSFKANTGLDDALFNADNVEVGGFNMMDMMRGAMSGEYEE